MTARPAVVSTLRRRRHRRLTLAAMVEHLEDRTVLAAVIPGFDQHGLVITNAQATGQANINVTSAANAQLSNNAQGSGLFINLDNTSGQLNALKNITITDVTVQNNGNAGVQIRLANLTLDSLVIDRAKITGNGGSGLYIDLTNVTIGRFEIIDSTNPAATFNPATGAATNAANSGASLISNNLFDGVHVLARTTPSTAVPRTITTMRLAGNVLGANVGHGAYFNLDNVNITNLGLEDNEAAGNTNGSGVYFETNRTNAFAGTVRAVFNTFTGNASHGLGFFTKSQVDGTATASASRIEFDDFYNNDFTNNQGSGVSVDLQAQTVWNATLLRNTFVGNQTRGFDLKAADTGTVTTDPADGDFLPTQFAFDVQFGDLTLNPQLVLVNANRFDQNRGAGIALELNDTSDSTDFTTGRFRILGNTITGTTADTDPNTDAYNGHAIVVVAAGSVALQNGSAIYANSTIDRNTLTGNAGDGIRVRVSEDSEFNGLTIGNTAGANQTFDVNGAFAGGGNVVSRQGDGNVIDNNGGNGISILRLGSAFVQAVQILDNRITRNDEGVYLQASNTYQTVAEAARPLLNVVNLFTVNNNDLSNNRLNGVHLRTEFNAVLKADMRYNRIDANGFNGVRLTGVENNFSDFENIGGVWVKNAITRNAQNGIQIENVVGSVNPLVVGRDGRDPTDNQSLGNFIFRNGEDGIEVGARPGLANTETPRDIRDGMEIINNHIIENGRNAVGSPYTAGKGIDIEALISSPREFRIDRNVISGNAGDGIELRNAGGMLRVTAEGNFIDLNGGRGVDLLNQIGLINYHAETFIHFGDVGTTLAGGVQVSNRNTIANNGLEGFYVVNTAAPSQTQDVSNESTAFATTDNVDVLGYTTVNLVLDIENNVIRDNGNGVPGLNNSPPSTLSGTGLVLNIGTQVSAASISTAPDLFGNSSFFLNDDFTGALTDAAAAGVGSNQIQGPGTIGILQQDSGGVSISGNGRVNARVVGNEFSGNGGDDVFIQSFVSLIPHATAGEFTDQRFRVDHYDRDPLARLNMVFTGNTVDSLDVIRGNFSQDPVNAGAHLDNAEGDWKSRTAKPNSPNPDGPFGNPGASRRRVGQRVAILGYTTDTQLPAGRPDFYYDGLGPSTFRVESNWRGTNTLRANALGDTFDDFYAESEPNTEFVSGASGTGYEWDEVSAGTFSFRTVSIGDVTVNEAGVATLKVRLTEAAPAGGLTVFYRTSDGSAKADPNNDGNTADGDYFATSSSITFAAGEIEKDIVIQLKPDAVIDPGEQFYVDLYQTSNGADFVDSRGVVTLLEPPAVTISDAQRVEGDNGTFQMVFTVTLSADPGTNVSVQYSTGGGTATAGSDYTAVPLTTLTFGAGETSKQVVVDVLGDTLLEGNETFNVTLSNPNGVTIADGTGVGTIVDDDTPTITITDEQVTEAAGGSTMTFTVTLSKAVNVAVTVDYATANGTAVAGSDYTATSGTLTFAPGETSKTIVVSILNDTVLESGEQFTVNLTNPTNGAVAAGNPGTGTGTIIDDDSPTVSISDAVVVEGDGGARNAVFTVTLSKAVGLPVTVNYATADATASAGSDYQAASGTLTFAAGQTSRTISVAIVGDLLPEQVEQFVVNLSNANNGSIVDGTGVGGIIDDDTPSITVEDAGVIESDGFVDVTVRLSKAVGAPVTVDYSVLSGTATSGTDFDGSLSPLTGTVTFAAGTTTQTIRIKIATNDGFEPTETFTVNLTNPTGGTIADATGVVRIIDGQNGIGLVVGAGAGVEPRVKVYDPRGNPRVNPEFFAYAPNFRGGVRVAAGDVNGDGITDIVVAPLSGNAPIRVFRGDSYAEIANFNPFADAFPGYNGGISISVGNWDGVAGSDNGALEIYASTTSGSNLVRVFKIANGTGVMKASFWAFSPTFKGGVTVAAADVTGEGQAEAIVAPVGGSGPLVRVNRAYAPSSNGTGVAYTYFIPFDAGLINIAAGDFDGNGRSEIAVSLRAGSTPTVRVFNGLTGALLKQFDAYSTSFRGGVNLGIGDINFDGKAELITTPASASPSVVFFFNPLTGAVLKTVLPDFPSGYTTGSFAAGTVYPPVGSPLQLAGPASGDGVAATVTQAQVAALAKAAVARIAASAGAKAAAKLATVHIVVADLPGAYLGEARPGTIVIDVNAGGQGWFVDQTPLLDEEYARGADGVYRAVAQQAKGKVDLLTVLTHELSHALGFADMDPALAPNSVMTATLSQGVRRATKEHLDDLFSDADLLGRLLTV